MTSASTPHDSLPDTESFQPMKASWLFDEEHVQHGRFAAPEKKKRRSLLMTILNLGLVGAIITAIIVFHVRLDYDNVDPEEATPAEEARQELAIIAHRISEQAELLGSEAPYTHTYEHATMWEDALGGVWLPWPDGNTPSGRANPTLITQAPIDTRPQSIIDDLSLLSTTAIEKSEEFTGEERSMIVRMALDARLCAAHIASHVGITPPASSNNDMTALATTLNNPDTLLHLDTARQWLEKDAAALPQSERTSLAKRIESITALEEEILAQGVADKRPAVAAFPSLNSGEKLSTLAIKAISSDILSHADQANAKQINAMVDYLYALYLTDDERRQADIF